VKSIAVNGRMKDVTVELVIGALDRLEYESEHGPVFRTERALNHVDGG
jgi:hypothetical protein